MYVFYSLLLACAALLSLPWWIIQMLRLGKYRSGLAERLGLVPARLNDAQPGSIWVHAVSVGEVLAVSQLVTDLQAATSGPADFCFHHHCHWPEAGTPALWRKSGVLHAA